MSTKTNFWTNLQRRHVVRAALAHLVFFWLVAQVAETALPYIGIVDEPVRWAVVAGVALFPVTLIVSWFFEHPWHRATSSRLATDISILLIILVTAGSWAIKNMPNVLHTRTSIVVLPFKHDPADPSGQGLSRALAYEINSLLMKSKSIDVIGYESANSPLLSGLDALAAAKKLGVQHALSGIISSYGDSLSLSVSLSSQSGELVWETEIEDRIDNLYDVQASIANAVQTHLGAGEDSKPIEKIAAVRCEMPSNPDALRRYYTARHHVEKRGDSKVSIAEQNEAVTLYEGLIEEYPDFAQARSGLAWALMHLLVYDPENNSRDINNTRAEALAREALEICDGLGEALVIGGNEADFKGNGWISWEQNLQLWMELQPGATENQQKYSRHLWEVGRLTEARLVAEKNYAMNPLSVRAMLNLSSVYQYEKRFDEAIALSDEARSLGSTKPDYAREAKNRAECRRELECQLEALPKPFLPWKDRLRQVYTPPQKPGDQEASLQIALELLNEAPSAVNWFNATACFSDHLTDLFYEAWDVSQEHGSYWFWPNLWLPSCGNVWESSRFPGFMEEVGLIEYWRAKGWPDACRPEGESVVCSQAIYEKNMAAGS